MSKSNKIIFFLQVFISITIAIVLVANAAWSEPISNPPNNNAPEPINVGGITQTKTGSFGVLGDFSVGGWSGFFGRVGVNTQNFANLPYMFNVFGNVGILKDPSVTTKSGPGGEFYLESPSNAGVSSRVSNWTRCGAGYSLCPDEGVPVASKINPYVCTTSDIGKSYNDDVELVCGKGEGTVCVGETDSYYRYASTVYCVAGTSYFSFRTNDGVLEFINSAERKAKFLLSQDGSLQLPKYTQGVAHFDASGNLTSSAVNLASGDVTGILSSANGGTGVSSCSDGQSLQWNGSQWVCAAGGYWTLNGSNLYPNDATGNNVSVGTSDPAGYKFRVAGGNVGIDAGLSVFGPAIFDNTIQGTNINAANIVTNDLTASNNVSINNSGILTLRPGGVGSSQGKKPSESSWRTPWNDYANWEFGSGQGDTCSGSDNTNDYSCDGHNTDTCYDKANVIIGQTNNGTATRQLNCVATAGSYAIQNYKNDLIFIDGSGNIRMTLDQNGGINANNIKVDNINTGNINLSSAYIYSYAGIGIVPNGSYKLDVNGSINTKTLCFNGSNCKTDWPVTSSIDWLNITNRPSGLDDGDQIGITAESDPTVKYSVKDGVDWVELSGIPGGFADNVDDVGITSESDPQVGAVNSGKWCVGSGSTVECATLTPDLSKTNELQDIDSVLGMGNTTSQDLTIRNLTASSCNGCSNIKQGSCTPGRHAKGYGCSLNVYGSWWAVLCDTINEDHGECQGTWDDLGSYECSSYFNGGGGFEVSFSQGKYTLTTRGKENNNTSPYWTTKSCTVN